MFELPNPENIKVSLYKHQIEGVKFLHKVKYGLLADEQGLGKTIEALVASSKFSHVLIVCPASLQENWADEVRKTFKTTSVTIIKPKKGKSTYTGLDQFNIISYGRMKLLASSFQNFDCVVLDECHYLRIRPEISGQVKKVYNYFLYFLKLWTPKAVYMLSGTPVLNNHAEFYYVFKIFSHLPTPEYKDCLRYYPSAHYFVSNFCYLSYGTSKYNNGIKIVASRNEEEFKQYLFQRYLRRTAEEVLDLPELVETNMPVEEVISQDNILLKAWDEFNKLGVSEIIVKAKVSSELNKAPATAQFVNEIKTDAGIVVFTEFREPARILRNFIADGGKKVVMITGETPVEKRHEYVKLFQSGEIEVLVCTIMSMNTGHTLTRSRYVVFNGLMWVGPQNEQALKRCHRIGSKDSVFVYYMVGSKIDKLITNTLRRKSKMINSVLE